jgi:hypothetical protein
MLASLFRGGTPVGKGQVFTAFASLAFALTFAGAGCARMPTAARK